VTPHEPLQRIWEQWEAAAARAVALAEVLRHQASPAEADPPEDPEGPDEMQVSPLSGGGWLAGYDLSGAPCA
jgi:hypothetical protein